MTVDTSPHEPAAAPVGGLSAGIVALVAAAGLVIQARATFGATGSLIATLWVLAGFFTIVANLILAVTFGLVAAGRVIAPRWIAGAVLAMLLVGITYVLLLRGLLHLSGGAAVANALLHYATPVLAPLWWLGVAPKGALGRGDPWRWALLPAAYLPWALARGVASGRFAYPFLDGERHGWTSVALICAAMALCFVAGGYALVWLDGALARRGAAREAVR